MKSNQLRPTVSQQMINGRESKWYREQRQGINESYFIWIVGWGCTIFAKQLVHILKLSVHDSFPGL